MLSAKILKVLISPFQSYLEAKIFDSTFQIFYMLSVSKVDKCVEGDV